jgi:predicted metal-binding membrane protein
MVRRDRLVVLLALLAVIALAGSYIVTGAGLDMSGPMVMPMVWTPAYALLVFVMWWTMMLAMMLPSATPMILFFAAANRRWRSQGAPFVPTGVFAGGYLLAWGGFSLAATGLQWWLESLGLLSSMEMASTSAALGGALLIAAGVYQLTPLKHACLRRCRSPLEFVTTQWRSGYRGALRMGAVHGLYCLGCCWVLMGLLFYGGVMNPYWIIGLAALILLEKSAPAGHWLSHASGAGLMVWGIALLASLAL